MRTSFQVDELNNDNYAVWKYKVKLLLTKDKIWSVVDDETSTPPTSTWKESDAQAYAKIDLLVEDN